MPSSGELSRLPSSGDLEMPGMFAEEGTRTAPGPRAASRSSVSAAPALCDIAIPARGANVSAIAIAPHLPVLPTDACLPDVAHAAFGPSVADTQSDGRAMLATIAAPAGDGPTEAAARAAGDDPRAGQECVAAGILDDFLHMARRRAADKKEDKRKHGEDVQREERGTKVSDKTDEQRKRVDKVQREERCTQMSHKKDENRKHADVAQREERGEEARRRCAEGGARPQAAKRTRPATHKPEDEGAYAKVEHEGTRSTFRVRFVVGGVKTKSKGIKYIKGDAGSKQIAFEAAAALAKQWHDEHHVHN